MRALLVLLAALSVGGAAEARSRGGSSSKSSSSGPVCRKGKPCGNSCIAQSAVCHQPEGTAKAAGDEKKPPPKTDDAPKSEDTK